MKKAAYSPTKSLLRYPILFGVLCILISECVGYIAIRLIVWAYEALSDFFHCRRYKSAEQQLAQARNFEEFSDRARDLDIIKNRYAWKVEDESPLYDWRRVKSSLAAMREHRVARDWPALMHSLSVFFQKRSLGYGIDDEALYSRTYFGTKRLIEDFLTEVQQSLNLVCSNEEIPVEDRVAFLRTSRKNYGRAALCLSGGARMSCYHFGVVKTLIDEDMLPNVISGTSGGALIAGMIAVRKPDELKNFFTPEIHRFITAFDEGWGKILYRFARTGVLFSRDHWRKKLENPEVCGDYTFKEAYDRTGRVLVITTVSRNLGRPIVLSYRTAPNVCIWSAMLASAALPYIIKPMELYEKDANGKVSPYHLLGEHWSDGSFATDIPRRLLAETHNVSYTIVSQANPHVVPFAFHGTGSSGIPSRHREGSGLRGGFLLSSAETLLKFELKKWLLIIEDLDLLPVFLGNDWNKVAIQKFFGNVTIYAKPRVKDYFTLLSDPSRAEVEYYLDVGMRSTWPKLCIISHRVTFDDLLEKHYRRLATVLRSRNAGAVHRPQHHPAPARASVSPTGTAASSSIPSSASMKSLEAAAAEYQARRRRLIERQISSGLLPDDLQYGSPATSMIENSDEDETLNSPVSRAMADSVFSNFSSPETGPSRVTTIQEEIELDKKPLFSLDVDRDQLRKSVGDDTAASASATPGRSGRVSPSSNGVGVGSGRVSPSSNGVGVGRSPSIDGAQEEARVSHRGDESDADAASPAAARARADAEDSERRLSHANNFSDAMEGGDVKEDVSESRSGVSMEAKVEQKRQRRQNNLFGDL